MSKWTNQNATIEVWTTREGALSAVGHDLVLEATSFQVGLDGTAITARVDADSLRVVGSVEQDGSVNRPGLSGLERAKVEKSIVKDVLEAKKYPVIRFEGALDGDQITGEIDLHGVKRSLSVRVETSDGYEGQMTLHQPDFGITPYKAFLGALKVEADVTVRFTLH